MLHTSRTILFGTLMLLVLVLTITACGKEENMNETIINEHVAYVQDIERTSEFNSFAIMDTEKGKMVIELFDLETPITVENFKVLVNDTFYNGLTFHNVQEGFKVQTGDPTGLGTGDSGTAPIPLETHPDILHSEKGMVGMAHYDNDVDTATSQFYIALDALPELDRKYAVFGKVVKGIEVLDAIEEDNVIRVITIVEAEEL